MDSRKCETLGILEFHKVSTGFRIINDLMKKVSLNEVQLVRISEGRIVGHLWGTYAAVSYALEVAIDLSKGDLELSIIGRPHAFLVDYVVNQDTIAINCVENVFLFEMNSYAQALEMTNNILLSTSLELMAIDNKTHMDGRSFVALCGSIPSIVIAKNMVIDGEMVTNIEPILLEEIRQGRYA